VPCGFGRRATFGGVARENIGPGQNRHSHLGTVPRDRYPEKGLKQLPTYQAAAFLVVQYSLEPSTAKVVDSRLNRLISKLQTQLRYPPKHALVYLTHQPHLIHLPLENAGAYLFGR
jgi:hypothetical protein